MVRRLARRQQPRRETPPQSPPHPQSSRALRAEDEGRRKKSPAPTSPHSLAQAWVEATERGSHENQVARELAEQLRGVTGPIPPAILAGIVAAWRKRYTYNTTATKLKRLRRIIGAIDRQENTGLRELLPRPGRQKPRTRVATADELQRLHAKAKPHIRLFLLLGLQLGLRFAETLAAGPAGWNREAHTLTVATKGGDDRTFKLTEEIEQLFALAPDVDTSFVMSLRGARCSRDTIRQDWQTLCQAAGLQSPLNPHDLRRTAADNLYRQTKDIMAAKALLGHASVETTAYYLKAYENAMQPLPLSTWTPKGEAN